MEKKDLASGKKSHKTKHRDAEGTGEEQEGKREEEFIRWGNGKTGCSELGPPREGPVMRVQNRKHHPTGYAA